MSDTIAFKKGQSVKASTVLGKDIFPGKIADIHTSTKGVWYEIQPAGGGATFRTRASKITAA